jgi:integrase
MNVKFYLRDLSKEKGNLNAGKEQPIWCYITFNGRRLRLSTQIKVLPNDWNGAKEKIRGTSLDVEKKNKRFKNIRNKAEAVADDYLGKVLTEDMLKSELLPILFPDKFKKLDKAKNLYEYLIEFVAENPKNIEPSSMKSYEQLKPLLIDFSRMHGKTMLDFDSVDSTWGETFTKWLKTEKNHSINNVDKHNKNIKALMKHSLMKGLHANVKFEFIKRDKEETKEIHLSKDQIKEIYQLEVEENHEHTKDLFVFSCLTGLRISDILGLKKHNWKGDYIEIETKKTKDKLIIPLRKTAKEILEKYDGQLPYVYEQKYNKQLKNIAEQIPSLHIEEIVYITKGGKHRQRTVYRYERVMSHTGRRSFATNEYLEGTDPLLIRAVTGHKSEKDFYNYIKQNQIEKATSLLEIFKNRKDF